MTATDTSVTIVNQALADIGTRSQISALNDGSQEATYANLYYTDVRNQLLRAANWNFAKKTTILTLWKALPGTPENTAVPSVAAWQLSYPAPPWAYSYIYPDDCLRVRRVVGQPQQTPIAPPIFSTPMNPPVNQRLPSARFEVAMDQFDGAGVACSSTNAAGLAAIAGGGTGYVAGDLIYVAGGMYGIPALLRVATISAGGVILTAAVRNGGTYTTNPSNPVSQLSTTGIGTGATFNLSTFAANLANTPIILTNQETALCDYTFAETNEGQWDSMFVAAMICAMAGKLAQPLTGDKALANQKFQLANDAITNARVADGDEGLTIMDSLPDWLTIRGIGGNPSYDLFYYPYGAMFPISPGL